MSQEFRTIESDGQFAYPSMPQEPEPEPETIEATGQAVYPSMGEQPHDGRVRIPERYGDGMKVNAPYGSYREAVEMSMRDLGNTVIGPVDLNKARLQGAYFKGSEVDADFTGANLKDSDFRQAEVEGTFEVFWDEADAGESL